MTELGAYEREITISASPETIFPYLTDPGLIVRWMGRMAELEPVAGGIYSVDFDGAGRVARGEFVEVSPPTRVVFTFGWESDESPVRPGSSTVEITLAADAESGDTVLRLVHRDLPTADSMAAHARGWEHYLARLATAASGGDAGADEWNRD